MGQRKHIPIEDERRFYQDGTLLMVLLIAAAFAIVAWLSVQHVNPLWDEQWDHQAASALLRHPLYGSGIDGSQARLPMYVTAAAYALFGESIGVARLAAIAIGVATIVLTFVVGRRWFNTATGLFAATLLAISPYFIGFSRTGLTEGDAFAPFTVLLALMAFEGYLRQRDTKRLVILAAALGLALAAKFYALFLLPPLILCDLIHSHIESTPDLSKDKQTRHRIWKAFTFAPEHRPVMTWVAAVGALVLATLVITQVGLVSAAIACWTGTVIALVLGIRRYVFTRKPTRSASTTEPVTPWLPLPAWVVILPLAATFCLVAFPEHVLQPEVARAFLRRLIRADHVEPMARVVDPARLYAGVILLKLGLPFGILTIAALIRAWQQSPRDPALRLLLAAVVLNLLLLITLPLRQCFYLMSIYPLLMLILAVFIVRVAQGLQSRRLVQTGWIALITTIGLLQLYNDIRVYPDFNLFGYETVGNRWLAAESRGYRNLIQISNDGTIDALQWCHNNVPHGQRVVSYLWDDHVIDAFLEKHPATYELVRRHSRLDPLKGPPVDDADYLILSLNNEVSYHDMPSPETLHSRFPTDPTKTIWRGPNTYRLPVTQILKRHQRLSINGN